MIEYYNELVEKEEKEVIVKNQLVDGIYVYRENIIKLIPDLLESGVFIPKVNEVFFRSDDLNHYLYFSYYSESSL